MNLGARAVLYTVRKWKKTLLVFCLLLAITTLVLSGLAIADAQEELPFTASMEGESLKAFLIALSRLPGVWETAQKAQKNGDKG